ncbi:hypothetical protein GC177_08025 [bacterium]|nr:hypothetical protein [bacterium]
MRLDSRHTVSVDAIDELEMPLRKQLLLTGFNTLRLAIDPEAHLNDQMLRARAELEAKINFYMVPDINEDFSADEKRRWFGTERVTRQDVTWERLEAILRPAGFRGSVFRVNDALGGSKLNHLFARDMPQHENPYINNRTLPVYLPRTVTAYPSQEQARAAAKLLRIMTRHPDQPSGSVAEIQAEHIENGLPEGLWVVSDTMNLATHNELRLLIRHFAGEMTPEHVMRQTQEIQSHVNSRLLEGEAWDAEPGVNTLLTLQGRPGVKMYRTVQDRHGAIQDDPEDVKRLDSLPYQVKPRLTNSIPPTVGFGEDGKLLPVNSRFEQLGNLLIGPARYQTLVQGRTHMGKTIRTEMGRMLHGQTEAESVYDLVSSNARWYNPVNFITDEAVGLVAGSLAVGATLLLAGTSYPLYALVWKSRGKDPLNHEWKAAVERATGMSFTQSNFSKGWTFRDTGGESLRQAIETAIPDTTEFMEANPLLGAPGNLLPADMALDHLAHEEDFAADFVAYLQASDNWPRNLPGWAHVDKAADGNAAIAGKVQQAAWDYASHYARYVLHCMGGQPETGAFADAVFALYESLHRDVPNLNASRARELNHTIAESAREELKTYLSSLPAHGH